MNPPWVSLFHSITTCFSLRKPDRWGNMSAWSEYRLPLQADDVRERARFLLGPFATQLEGSIRVLHTELQNVDFPLPELDEDRRTVIYETTRQLNEVMQMPTEYGALLVEKAFITLTQATLLRRV